MDTAILYEGTLEECEALEEKYISEYDTFNNGLNLTKKGKGLNEECTTFNTLGYKFSEESRRKMSESAKKRTDGGSTGYKFSDEVKAHWSSIRKGKVWGPVKIDSKQLLSDWERFNPSDEECEALISSKSKDSDIKFFKNRSPLFKRVCQA